MSGVSQVGGAHVPAAWRQLIDLGAHLLEITRSHPDPGGWIIPFQQLTVNSAVQLFGGQAGLWFAARLTRQHLRNQPAAEFNAPPGDSVSRSSTPLVQQAFNSGHICLQAGKQVFEMHAGAQLPGSDEGFEALAIPLLLSEPVHGSRQPSLSGVLQLQRAAGPAYSPDEIDLALGFSTQVALALQTGLAVALQERQQDGGWPWVCWKTTVSRAAGLA